MYDYLPPYTQLDDSQDQEVESDNYEDAISSAEEIMSMTDFGALNYDVDAEVYAVEDEDGNTRYEF